MAATMGNVEAVRILLKAGAQVTDNVINDVSRVAQEVITSPRAMLPTNTQTQAPALIFGLLTDAKVGKPIA